MIFDEWARAWNVPFEAQMDFRRRMMLVMSDATPPIEVEGAPGSESRQQSLVRLEANEYDVWLTRNNVGALLDERGVPVRYGLANESSAQNAIVKSSDLIGMKPILIGPQHVGSVIAQFVSRECKKEGWVYTGTKREIAQLNWNNFVISKGGDAAFCTGPGSFNYMTRWSK